MDRNIISGFMLMILLTSISTLIFNVQTVRASGTIYIRADGSIDPQTAPLLTVDNVTYIFADNVNDSIVIERNNIIVAGGGHSLRGTGIGTGIDVSDGTNVTIRDFTVKGFDRGIELRNSSYVGVNGNNLTNNVVGIELYHSVNNGIYRNIVGANTNGIWLMSFSNYNMVSENDILENSELGIFLNMSSVNILVENEICKNQAEGILLNSSSNNILYRNNILWNTAPVTSFGSINTWDNGYDGNHWGFGGIDSDGDGIVDIPYTIDADNRDNYPLYGPYLFADVNHDGLVSVADIVSCLDAFGSNQSLPGWNPHYDVNEDGRVNMRDIGLVVHNLAKMWFLPKTDRLEFTGAYASENDGIFTIYLVVKNTGIVTAIINVSSTLYNGKLATDWTNQPVATYNSTTLDPGEVAISTITLIKSPEWMSGMTVELMLHTVAGNDYFKVVVLP